MTVSGSRDPATGPPALRGYFAIGCEGISKPMNIGALMRTAHAFGAAFVFTVDAVVHDPEFDLADTSGAAQEVPLYHFASIEEWQRPKGCQLVGIELHTGAVDLPSFRHPRQAAYILGSERGGLSERTLAACDHVVQIPMRFSVNLALAGGIVMYDRLITLGRFAPRPGMPGGPAQQPERSHVFAPPFPLREE